MTIPSIGGNGDATGKIHIHQPNIQPAQAQNDISQIPQQPAGAEQPAATPEQISAVPAQQDTETPVETSDPNLVQTTPKKEAEKEYSIAQFQKDYAELLESKVMPVLNDFEGERKKRLAGATTLAVFFSILAILLFLFYNGNRCGDLIGLCIAAAGGCWFLIKKSFEKKVKRLIMPVLMHAVPGFYWQETPPVKKEEIQQSKILPFANKLGYRFDDCFIGKYRNVKVAISECECTLGSGNNSKTILEGAVIKFQMNKKFDGMTVIRPKKPGYRDKYDDLKRANMSEVKLEDPEFDKKFTVYSTDQVEARYLITTAFMERFKGVQDAFISRFAYCSFCGDSVFIAPHTGRDLFNLCSLVKPIGNREQFETLFNEFASILALVDHFKLDKKLGL